MKNDANARSQQLISSISSQKQEIEIQSEAIRGQTPIEPESDTIRVQNHAQHESEA